MHLASFSTNVNEYTYTPSIENFGASAAASKYSQITTETLASHLNYPVEEIILLAEQGKLAGRKLLSNGKWMFSPNAAKIYCDCLEESYSKVVSLNSVTEVTNFTNSSSETNLDENLSKAVVCNDTGSNVQTSDLTTQHTATETKQKKQSIKPQETAVTKDLKLNIIRRETANKVLQRFEEYFSKNGSKAKSALLKKTEKDLHLIRNQSVPDSCNNLNLTLKFDNKKQRYRTEFRNRSNPYYALIYEIIAGFLGKKVTKDGLRKYFSNDELHSKLEFNKLIYKAASSQNRLSEILLDNEGTLFIEALFLGMNDNSTSSNKTKEKIHHNLLFWGHLFCDLKLNDITNSLMFEIMNKFNELDIEESTRANYTAQFNRILELAKQNDWLNGISPLKGGKSNQREFIEIPLSKWQKFSKLYATDEQEERFLLALWHSVQRESNIRTLKASQINFNKRTINIHSSEHKIGKTIDVAISQETVNVIKNSIEYKKRNGIEHDCVFATDSDGTLPSTLRENWKECLKACELPTRITPHHLRHYGITDMYRNGTDLEDIMLVSGHTTNEGLMRYVGVARDISSGHIASNNRSYNE